MHDKVNESMNGSEETPTDKSCEAPTKCDNATTNEIEYAPEEHHIDQAIHEIDIPHSHNPDGSICVVLNKRQDEENSQGGNSVEDSVPSQTDTVITCSTNDDDNSLDSLSNPPSNPMNEAQPDTPRLIPAEIYEKDPSQSFSSNIALSGDKEESVENESECKESIDIVLENEVGIPSDGSIVSAIQINDSFCESPSFKPSIEQPESYEGVQPKTGRPRKVTFSEKIVTEEIELNRWTIEEKSYLFYTGKEMYQFRIGYMMELHESMELKNDDWSVFNERGGIRIFWSMYAAVLDFFSCKGMVQFCCGTTANVAD